MKNQILLLLILFLPTGCDLNVEILDEVSGDLLVNQKNSEANFAAPAYAQLLGTKWPTAWLTSRVSDELMVPSRVEGDWDDGGSHRKLHKHTWLTTDPYVYNTWSWADESVSKANTGLFFLDQIEASEERDYFKAELGFLRAFFRFYQFDLFRQIPLRNEFDQNFQIPPPVISGEEAFLWIEDELLRVIPLLRDRVNTPYGRATKTAAQMLLAKLYLNAEVFIGQPKWEEALEQCTEIINSGRYAINPDYFGIFGVDNHDNSEAILVSRRSRSMNLNELMQFWRMSLHYHSAITEPMWADNTGGFNGPVVVLDFMYTWDLDGDPGNGIETTDKRFYDDRIKVQTGTNLGFLIGPQFKPDGSPIEDDRLSSPDNFVQLNHTIECPLRGALRNAGVRVMKYEPDYLTNDIGWRDNNDLMIFRYADLWLMAVEAKFRLGKTGEALTDINVLRQIRNAPILTSITEQDILNERGFELYWEGWRRQDLIRFDQFTRPWASKDQSAKFREVFPIPDVAVSSNPNLTQNPGY